MDKCTYYLLYEKLVGKRDIHGDWLYHNGEWKTDDKMLIMDHIHGFDPSEPEDSPYRFGSHEIMKEMREIIAEEAEAYLKSLE